MGFVRNPISTVNMGLAVGWSAVVLSFGKKGWRKSLPHSLGACIYLSGRCVIGCKGPHLGR